MKHKLTEIKRWCNDGQAISHHVVAEMVREIERLEDALDKIRDPKRRDHSEADAYTTLGCVMNIADEALQHAL